MGECLVQLQERWLLHVSPEDAIRSPQAIIEMEYMICSVVARMLVDLELEGEEIGKRLLQRHECATRD